MIAPEDIRDAVRRELAVKVNVNGCVVKRSAQSTDPGSPATRGARIFWSVAVAIDR